VLGCEELAQDPRFASTALRAANQAALCAALQPYLDRQEVEPLLSALAAAGVPSGRINGYAEALADPQVAHMGWVQELELPGGGTTRSFGSPVVVDGHSAPIRRPPPALGEHTAEVLAEIGILQEDMDFA
jgi:crotonobetainyl-CoA:carnitine CoA-transferase CaiB-like acyl-CoA transferase